MQETAEKQAVSDAPGAILVHTAEHIARVTRQHPELAELIEIWERIPDDVRSNLLEVARRSARGTHRTSHVE